MTVRTGVVVIGGGITGMVAARRLAGAGAGVTLLERSSRLGGLVTTDHDDGFVIEGGADSFVAGKGSVLALARDLGIDGQVVSSRPEHRGSYVWWDGDLLPLPGGLLLIVPARIRSLLRSPLLSWAGRARALADLVLPRSDGVEDESLGSFVTRRLGREMLDRIAEPLIAGIHAAEPDTMSLRASFPRLLEMEREYRSLILAARSAASRPVPPHGLSHFASFAGGMGQLVTALAADSRGAEIRTGIGVIGIDVAGSRGYRMSLDDGSALVADGVVFATPAPVTSRLLVELVPDAATALSGIHQVASSSVTLAYEAEDLPPLAGSGFVVPSVQGRMVSGVSFLSQKWENRVPGPRFVLLRAFVDRNRGRELALADEPLLTKVVLEELKVMVGIDAAPAKAWVRVFEEGLHQYTMGHLDRVATAERAMEAEHGLALAGAAFHGIGLNECIDSGHRAAESVLHDLAMPVGATLGEPH
ncbi:MAG TPA: protoporphyrinogen oxidase [Acidimicrobiia bacterium]|nr:protoporphyrinogen oxidase [Acidimicrobiia bacterium]